LNFNLIAREFHIKTEAASSAADAVAASLPNQLFFFFFVCWLHATKSRAKLLYIIQLNFNL